MKSKIPFGSNLQEVMLSIGMSQVALSRKTGLTEAAVHQIIYGKREPQLSSIVAILKVIQVTFEKLTELRRRGDEGCAGE
mgnify:FL=1